MLHDAFHFPSLVWDWPIAIYLFLLGISAGATSLSVLLRRKGAGSESGIIKATAILAPVSVVLGLLILIFHLARPWTFWKLMFHYQFDSVMSMGVMLFQVYMAVLPWVTALVLTAMLPLLFTRIASPSGNHQARTPVWPMLRLRQARLGVNGCILSGIVLGVLYGLMPLYLNHQGVSDGAIGYWMAVMVSAGILGQWPVGRLADRFGRLPVLRVQVLVVILGAMAMLGNAAMGPTLFILGAAGFTLYPVAMAWACEKVEQHQLVAMNQALLLSYTIGSLLGPTLTALLMQHYSDHLLFMVIAGVSLVYLLMLLRKMGEHPTPMAHA